MGFWVTPSKKSVRVMSFANSAFTGYILYINSKNIIVWASSFFTLPLKFLKIGNFGKNFQFTDWSRSSDCLFIKQVKLLPFNMFD